MAGPGPQQRLPRPVPGRAALLPGVVRVFDALGDSAGGVRRAPRRGAAAPGRGDTEHRGRGRTQADRGGARGAVGRRAAARRVTAGVPQSLAGSPAAQARLLLGMYPWKGYTLMEEDACLKLGWKDLSLQTCNVGQCGQKTCNVLENRRRTHILGPWRSGFGRRRGCRASGRPPGGRGGPGQGDRRGR